MSRNVRVLRCTPEDVFEVLGDGWLYPSWVVGASRMREVDETWPMAGAELHHSVGVWPALINDKTVVEEFVPSRLMVMRARGWPVGEARVRFEVKPRDEQAVVRIQEEAIAGPATLVPRVLMDILLHWRNAETLHRLAYLAEGRAQGRTPMSTAQREMSETGEDDRMDAESRVRDDSSETAAADAGRMDVEANENPLAAATPAADAAGATSGPETGDVRAAGRRDGKPGEASDS
jgi:hypothetical protein